jgi:hypothetical protein
LFAGTDVCGFSEHFAYNLQRRADDGKIAAGPSGLLAFLDGGKVRRSREAGRGESCGDWGHDEFLVG